jgi:hypothetical protein
MVVMLIVMVALGTIAGLTVISVQGGATQVSVQRFSAMAMYAAESGAATTMDWLRTQHAANHFTDALRNAAAIPGNGVQPGVRGNLLSDDQQGWYEVTLRNNLNDPQYPTNPDVDGDDDVIIQVTGHGPNGAMRRLEWEVRRDDASAARGLVLVGWRDLF